MYNYFQLYRIFIFYNFQANHLMGSNLMQNEIDI